MISFDVCQCGAPLQRNERPTPKPQGSEVLLRVLAAGVCHSDIHIWEGFYEMGAGKRMNLLDRGIKLPLTMGHENVGEVVAMGPDVKGVKIGDRRLVFPWIGCGQCNVCKSGEEQLCTTAPKFIGVFVNGGYGDHVLVPHERYLLDLAGLAPERAAPLACSGVTTYGALKKLGATLQREPLVIIGAGGLGFMCLALARAMGSPGVIVVDIDAAKRESAIKAGATAVVDGKAADAVAQLTKLTGGVWSVIDLVGSSQTVKLAIDCLTKGGKLIVVGLFGGDITISTPTIPLKAMTIQGSYVGSLAELKELLDLVRQKGLPPLPVATRPLTSADAALNDLRAGNVIGRLVLTP